MSSPQLVTREVHQAPESHSSLLLYHVTPPDLSPTFTLHLTPVPFCSAAPGQLPVGPRAWEASYGHKGGENVPELPWPAFANAPVVTDLRHSLLRHPSITEKTSPV